MNRSGDGQTQCNNIPMPRQSDEIVMILQWSRSQIAIAVGLQRLHCRCTRRGRSAARLFVGYLRARVLLQVIAP